MLFCLGWNEKQHIYSYYSHWFSLIFISHRLFQLSHKKYGIVKPVRAIQITSTAGVLSDTANLLSQGISIQHLKVIPWVYRTMNKFVATWSLTYCKSICRLIEQGVSLHYGALPYRNTSLKKSKCRILDKIVRYKYVFWHRCTSLQFCV